MIVIQIFKAPSTIFEAPSEEVYIQRGTKEGSAPTCREEYLFSTHLPVSRPHKMALLEEAKRVAGQFDYSSEELNKGVKAFIQQMSGLTLGAGES